MVSREILFADRAPTCGDSDESWVLVVAIPEADQDSGVEFAGLTMVETWEPEILSVNLDWIPEFEYKNFSKDGFGSQDGITVQVFATKAELEAAFKSIQAHWRNLIKQKKELSENTDNLDLALRRSFRVVI